MKKEDGYIIHQNDIETIARMLLPEIVKYYENEDNRRLFDEWKSEQKKTGDTKAKCNPESKSP